MSDYTKAKNFLSKQPASKQEAIAQDKLERQITTVREDRLRENPIIGKYGLEHLSKIHKYLFDGLYEHAGRLRPPTENWGKQNYHDTSLYSEFLPIADGVQAIAETSQFLQENNFLKDFEISETDKAEWDKASALSGTHFVLYEDGKGGFTGEEQEIDIEPLLNVVKRSLIEKSLITQKINNNLLKNLSEKIMKENYPALSQKDIDSIQHYKDQILSRTSDTEKQNIALKCLQEALPKIESGEIKLPELKKEKGGDIDR